MKGTLIRLHTAVFLWGFTGVLGRAITLNEAWLVWWRMLITIITLWLLFYFSKRIKEISLKDFFKIAAIGTMLSIHWLFFYGSIKYADVSIALTCLSTTGLLSAVIEPLFFGRRINPYEITLGLLALVGIAVIYMTNLSYSVGICIGLLSALFLVIVSVMNKRLVTAHDAERIALYQFTGGFLGLTVLMPLYNFLFPPTHMLPYRWDWLWLFILSWCCTILTFMLYIRALKHISAFTLNLTLTLEPVYGILLAFLLYHENETLSKSFFIGFGLILLAVFLQMFRLVKEHRKLPVNTL